MGKTIKVDKVRYLYDYVMYDLKMEQLNERIINGDWHTLNYHFGDSCFDNSWFNLLKSCLVLGPRYRGLTKLNKTDHRDIQI